MNYDGLIDDYLQSTEKNENNVDFPWFSQEQKSSSSNEIESFDSDAVKNSNRLLVTLNFDQFPENPSTHSPEKPSTSHCDETTDVALSLSLPVLRHKPRELVQPPTLKKQKVHDSTCDSVQIFFNFTSYTQQISNNL